MARDKRRPALLARDVWLDEKRWRSRRDGLDPDRPRGGECVRIDPVSGAVIGVVERPTASNEAVEKREPT